MNINSINGVNTQAAGQTGTVQASDAVSRNIQNQIANAQKQLQDLSSNEDMTAEEKMKKRQEIQQQINDLNNQLRQHQIELRKEKQQSKESSGEKISGGNKSKKSGSQGAGLSQESMKALISADSAVDQSQVQGSVATRMEDRAGVLKAEIKQDSNRGRSVEAKEEELARTEQRAVQAAASQINTLGEADKEIKEAAKTEQKTEKPDKEEQVEAEDEKKEKVTDTEQDAKQETEDSQLVRKYTSVDIRL